MIPPLFSEAHCGRFGAHLRDWPMTRTHEKLPLRGVRESSFLSQLNRPENMCRTLDLPVFRTLELHVFTRSPILIFRYVFTVYPCISTGVIQSVIDLRSLPCVSNEECAHTATRYIWGPVRDRS